ncbi:MAG: ABC transporter permease subunit [Pseudomonadota bacterium]|nr:ABC transporter permease subunit [Pseudomonadota bacterium]
MSLINFFSTKDIHRSNVSLIWDALVLIFIAVGIFLISSAAGDMVGAYELGDPINIDLAPSSLPYYASRTVLRMFIALFISLICAFFFGALAAKNSLAEKIIIPAIDVMQSIPVIGFLEVSFLWIITHFKGSFLGPEMVSIFAVFVSQVWNLVLSYYESLKRMPKELYEVAEIYKLSSWQRFFKLEAPYASPGLIWNSMLSLSAGWFFVVAGEAITIANHDVSLPGIGSYIALATEKGDYTAIYYAIACLFVVIMIYDQMIFRPLNYWLLSQNSEEYRKPNWFYIFISRSRVIQLLRMVVFRGAQRLSYKSTRKKARRARKPKPFIFSSLLALGVAYTAVHLYQSLEVFTYIGIEDVELALLMGLYTAIRVFVLVFICCVIWIPIGIYLGLNSRVADILQPVIQFLAAFPPNMLYPLVGSLIISKGYNPNIWLSPLIVLGTQWYILFNVIAGVRSLPVDLLMMSKSFGLSQIMTCRKVIIPGILPSLLTGVITAAGGAWNTSILAEVAQWQNDIVYADGLGAYIMMASKNADTHLVSLGVVVMCLYVFMINRVVWLPLYRVIERRYGRV